jgi:hypothetical protein
LTTVAFTKGSAARDRPGMACMVRTCLGGGDCVQTEVVAAGRREEIECRTVVYKGQHQNAKYVTKSHIRPSRAAFCSRLFEQDVTRVVVDCALFCFRHTGSNR